MGLASAQMAKQEFILQGFTDRTHAAAARELFAIDDVKRVIISVAFVSSSGVEELSNELKRTRTQALVLAGIRNEITSYQALSALAGLVDELYTVDTGSRSVLFHPKLFLVRGVSRAKLLVGSANLTLGGLNNNIEASLLLDLDLQDSADRAVVEDIEKQLTDLLVAYPDHVVKVNSPATLDALLASGRIVDETAPAPLRSTIVLNDESKDTVSRIKLRVPALRSALAKVKAAVKTVARDARASKEKGAALEESSLAKKPQLTPPQFAGVVWQVVWRSKPLSERDLSIPSGSNTHPTGSVNLDKGLLAPSVDHRHYFRDDVFNLLEWQPTRTAFQEAAYANFQLTLKGVSIGDFTLKVSHSTNTESRTYKQRNATTSLSWGLSRSHIARQDLIGRTLTLYRDVRDPAQFRIEID